MSANIQITKETETFDNVSGKYEYMFSLPNKNLTKEEASKFIKEHTLKILNSINENENEIDIIPKDWFYGILCKKPNVQCILGDGKYTAKLIISLMKIHVQVMK